MSYTPAEVSAMLDLKPSTLRRYSVDFEPFLSDSAKSGGRKRRYSDDDVLKLKVIKEMSRERRSGDDIRQALQNQVVNPPGQTSALALLPQVLQRFENLDSTIRELQADRDDLRARLERLEEWLKMPFWKRWGKKPPE